MRRVLLVLLAQATCAGFCGGGPGIPEVDACDDPGAIAGITTAELGTGDEQAFTPLEHGAEVRVTYGPQGAAMLPIRLRFGGTNLPSCVRSRVVLQSGEGELINAQYTLRTYEDDETNTRSTRALFLILGVPPPDGARGELHIAVAPEVISRTIKISGGETVELTPVLEPARIAVAPGGTAILSLSTAWVPFDPLLLANTAAGVSAPATLPGGSKITFRIRAAESAKPGTLAITPEAKAEIVIAPARAPGAGDLAIREVFFAEGDADQNGNADPIRDQFIEIQNRRFEPLELNGIKLSADGRTIYTFTPELLGPGEARVIYSDGFDLRATEHLAIDTVTSIELTRPYELHTALEIDDNDTGTQPMLWPRDPALPFTPNLNARGEPFAEINP